MTIDYTKWDYPKPPFSPTCVYSGAVIDIADGSIFFELINEYEYINSTKTPNPHEWEMSLDEIPKSEDEFVFVGAYLKIWFGPEDEFVIVFNRKTWSQEEIDECEREANELFEALDSLPSKSYD